MNDKITVNHVALCGDDRSKAAVFFTKILGIPKLKSFTLDENLSEGIFGIDESVTIDVYDNGHARFEVFNSNNRCYNHVCLEVNDTKMFIDRCKQHGLKPFVVKKNGRDLLFVRDFSNNLYEVKEK